MLGAPPALAEPPAATAPPYPATGPAGSEEGGGADPGEERTPGDAAPPMPRRRPGASIRGRDPVPPAAEYAAGMPFAQATPELLRRLLDGLRQLDEDDPRDP